MVDVVDVVACSSAQCILISSSMVLFFGPHALSDGISEGLSATGDLKETGGGVSECLKATGDDANAGEHGSSANGAGVGMSFDSGSSFLGANLATSAQDFFFGCPSFSSSVAGSRSSSFSFLFSPFLFSLPLEGLMWFGF